MAMVIRSLENKFGKIFSGKKFQLQYNPKFSNKDWPNIYMEYKTLLSEYE